MYSSITIRAPNGNSFMIHASTGIMSILSKTRAVNDLGHPLFENIRSGDWMLHYIANRLKPFPGTKDVSRYFLLLLNSLEFYNSNHPISVKLSVICILTHRAEKVCSTPELLAKEMDYLHKVLQVNHYPAQSFQQAKPQQKANRNPKPTNRKAHRRSQSYHTRHQGPH